MNKAEILLLFLYTTIIVAIMSFSHISLFFNIMLFFWILVHFTLVVVITSFLLKKAINQEIKKEIAWITFGALFLFSGMAGLYLFPTEEISRLLIIEPGILILSILSLFTIKKLKDNSLLNNKFIFYILVTLMLIFIIYSIFIPLTNSLFIEDTIYYNEISKSEAIKDSIGKRDFLIISKTTVNNPTPIYLSIPIEQTRYCLYVNEGNSYTPYLAHKNTTFRPIEDAWINIDGEKINNLDFGTPRFFIEETNIIVGDAAVTGGSYYQYTKKRPFVVRLKPFSSMIINQGAVFEASPPSGLSEVNIIEIVERGENRHPGGTYQCNEAKVLTSINLS